MPLLRPLVRKRLKESIELTNRVVIEIHTASFRSTRGYTIVAALCDEIAFWPVDEHSAEPDKEVLAALRPGMANVPGSLLLCLSSPYARRGELYRAYERFYGRDTVPNVLIWKAPSRVMNPTLPQRVLDEAFERDPSAARSEWQADFRSDLESYIGMDALRACVDRGVTVRPARLEVA